MNAAQNFPARYELEALMAEKKIPGLSMVIIENAEVIWHLDLGVKNSQAKDPVDSETLFEVASLSKPVFAYGILKMVESGQLNLDKPLAEYLPYSDIENDERVNFITARMVLAHTSGFPNWRPKNDPLKIHFEPGERFSYSGEGFLYLQKVIEHISGLSLEEYIKKNVFIPLKMNHSTFMWVSDNRKALGHNDDGSPIEVRAEPPNAAFTLHTSALDYARFITAIFKEIGLESDTINEMFRLQVKVPEGTTSSIDKCSGRFSDSISWGLGWGLQRTKMGDSFWHWGDNQGVKSFIVGFNNRNTAIIIFTNSSNGLSAISEIIQKYLKFPQPAFDWLDASYSSLSEPMNVCRAIRSRKSCRAYLNQDVSPTIVMKILEAARWAPSGVNHQPTQVAVLGKETISKLAKTLVEKHTTGTPPNPDYVYCPRDWPDIYKSRRKECGLALYHSLSIPLDDLKGRKRHWENNYHFFHAPVGLIIFLEKNMPMGSWMDAGMFIQNVLLAAQDFGLATCPQAAFAEYPDVVREVLNLDNVDIICGIAMGYEDNCHPLNSYRTKREPIETLARWYT